MSIDSSKVLYTNADQFLNKVHDLQTFITGDEPDLTLISELLPKNRSVFINISDFMIPGYSLYLNFDSTADASTTLGIRGVGIFVSKRFLAVQVLFENSNFKDHVWASINLQGHDKLLIGCIYRSPSTSMETSISSLCSLLDCLQGFTHLLICGDFNLKDINWSSMTVHPRNSHIESFLDKIHDLFLFQHVVEPTHFRRGTTPSLLDLVFTNEPHMVRDITYLPGLGKSDHVCLCFSLLCYAHYKDTRPLRYDTRAVDYDAMCTELEDIDWANIMNPMNTLDAWNFFTTVFQETIGKFVPLRKSGHKRSTYMTTEAFDLRKLKRKLWKRYCLSKAVRDSTVFKDTSNKLRSLTRNLRPKHEANLVSNIAKNPKSFWRYVNTSLKTRPDIDAIKRIDGSLASSDQEKADLLNSYFSSIFTREDLSNIPNFEVNEDIPLLDNISISPSMVWREIKKLKSEKSAGPDGWPIQVLKQCS